LPVKAKIVLTGLIAVVSCCVFALTVAPPVKSTPGIPVVTAVGAGGCYVVCPQGDGSSLSDIDAVITVTVTDYDGYPITRVPASDVWLVGCSDGIVLCGGSNAINADSMTNDNGVTTISGRLAAGGCDSELLVVVMGIVASVPGDPGTPMCLPYETKSPDITGSGGFIDGVVDLIDLVAFAGGYTSPPNPYDACLDFNCDGVIDIVDFAKFAQHYLHHCL
jgi:hypothetical protein